MRPAQKKQTETPENGGNKVPEKPPSRIGRPKLEDSLTLTPEMERFAWETSRGFTPAETAERMAIPVEKATRYATAPVILERIQVLLGNRSEEWRSMQDELLTACYRQALKFVAEGKVPWQNLQWLIDRLEQQRGLHDEPAAASPVRSPQGGRKGTAAGAKAPTPEDEQPRPSLFDSIIEKEGESND